MTDIRNEKKEYEYTHHRTKIEQRTNRKNRNHKIKRKYKRKTKKE